VFLPSSERYSLVLRRSSRVALPSAGQVLPCPMEARTLLSVPPTLIEFIFLGIFRQQFQRVALTICVSLGHKKHKPSYTALPASRTATCRLLRMSTFTYFTTIFYVGVCKFMTPSCKLQAESKRFHVSRPPSRPSTAIKDHCKSLVIASSGPRTLQQFAHYHAALHCKILEKYSLSR
jgi:hypothetical protein